MVHLGVALVLLIACANWNCLFGGVNVAESPAVRAKFHRLRDEMYWKGREWFEARDCECANTEIGAELADVLYSFTSSGLIKVEGKDDIKERLGRSPDIGEAFLLSLVEDCQSIHAGPERRARHYGGQGAWIDRKSVV